MEEYHWHRRVMLPTKRPCRCNGIEDTVGSQTRSRRRGIDRMMEIVQIESRDYWFQVIEYPIQHWALIDPADSGVVIWFFSGTGSVFDQLNFTSKVAATEAL